MVSGVLHALSICAPALIAHPPEALAQIAEPSVLSADIPAQPLAQALAAFASQTGLQVVYVSEIVSNQRSRAVRAGSSPREALAKLLRGTRLQFEYLTPLSIRILAASAPPNMASRPDDKQPDEIIVSANRREESLQDVPLTVQVLTGAELARLNAATFDDWVAYLPGVTAHGVGPAQNNIYVRGLGTSVIANEAAAANSSFPNVAVYLDEQSAQLPGRNLDLYAADLDRIEVLEGPQGTLFGAGAEAGVLRYITNKPRLDVTEARVNAGYATTAHGQPSSALDAVANIPVIAETLTVRAVIYNEKRGGYIDNIPATFARSSTDNSIQYAHAGGQVPVNSVVIDNAALIAPDINSLTYQGMRVQALYRINDDWNALVAQSYQDMEADGVFTEAATNWLGQPQPALTAQLFNPSYDKDRFENTSLTLKGRISALEVLYTGAYLVRNVEQVEDYTAYAHSGYYVDYYQCVNTGNSAATARCFTPSSTWRDRERNTHQSHELRINTPDEWRIRAVGGLFHDNYRIQDQGDWFYLTALPYFRPIGPPTGYFTLNGQTTCGCTPGAMFVPFPVTSNNPNVRPPGDGYFNDVTRGYRQEAVYTSIDADLIPQTLTGTVGTRYSDTRTTEVGSFAGSFGCELLYDPSVPDPCLNRYAWNLNAQQLARSYSGLRSRANLTWRVSPDALLYYTWSQGFRSGGFNRAFSVPLDSPLSPGDAPWQAQARLHKGWTPSLVFAPDSLLNNELGWKTAWMDRRLQWSGAIYQENWNHAQTDGLDIRLLSNGDTFDGGNYRVRGIESSALARLAPGLSLQAQGAWSHSELVKEAAFFWADGTPIDFNTLQTSSGATLVNPAGTRGSPLAGAPSFQGNIRVRYEFTFNAYEAFLELGAVHQSRSLASTDRLTVDSQGNSVAYELPPFTTYDTTLGAARDGWRVQVYGENLTDTRGQLYANAFQGYKAVTVNRPRTIGVRLTYEFHSAPPAD